MKKLSLIFFVLALAAGVTFAQTNNIGLVTQSDLSQTATIDQQGISNKSVVTQSNEANTVDIKQINSEVTGYMTDAEVYQSGKRNLATIVQISGLEGTIPNAEGTLKVFVNQYGDDNEALQHQGPSSQQGKSYAEIIQGGNGNYASQNQLRYANDARINQAGSNNIAMQAQDAVILPEEEGSANKAVISQSGDWNQSTQTQDGWANDVSTDQSGSFNKSTQYQQDYSFKSIASVNQSGDWNTAGQTQLGYLNKATIGQQSYGNTATQNQTAPALRRESGYDPLNEAEISQYGDSYNVAIQNQTFSDELADNGKSTAVKNMASITQNGYGNNADQTQTGNDNLSSILQAGNFNVAHVTQNLSVLP